MRYCQPTKVDSPTVGCLYDARKWKARTWKAVKQLRQQIRECHSVFGERSRLRLELLKAESSHAEAMRFERECLKVIEERANELGLTTKR